MTGLPQGADRDSAVGTRTVLLHTVNDLPGQTSGPVDPTGEEVTCPEKYRRSE